MPQFIDGKTYFFKGKDFWAFDDIRMAVEADAPKPIGEHWMHCPRDDRLSIGMALQGTTKILFPGCVCSLHHFLFLL